jgi:hypothetical protein
VKFQAWLRELQGLGEGTFRPGWGNFQAWVKELPGLGGGTSRPGWENCQVWVCKQVWVVGNSLHHSVSLFPLSLYPPPATNTHISDSPSVSMWVSVEVQPKYGLFSFSSAPAPRHSAGDKRLAYFINNKKCPLVLGCRILHLCLPTVYSATFLKVFSVKWRYLNLKRRTIIFCVKYFKRNTAEPKTVLFLSIKSSFKSSKWTAIFKPTIPWTGFPARQIWILVSEQRMRHYQIRNIG